MALYPGATHRLIARHNKLRMAAYNRANLHVAVSEASSLFNHFSGVPDCSHFYVRKDGSMDQYIDTTYRSAADRDGNDATVSIETQGGVNNPQGEPWTDAQVRAIAKLYAWIAATHGMPMRLATSSKLGEESKGLSWHRLGVDGNFPAMPNILAGRLQRGGGMHYSKARGKICPGDAKIRQIPGILELAKGGGSGGSVAPAPVQPPVQKPTIVWPDVRPLQGAVGAQRDNVWGPDTDKRFDALRSATTHHGYTFPYGKVYLQQIVGTKADGVWGPNSAKAHDRKVAEVQRLLGVHDDGIWGPNTEAAYLAIRSRARKP